MSSNKYDGCTMTHDKWDKLLLCLKEERVVLVIGDGFLYVNGTPLDEYLKKRIWDIAKQHINDSEDLNRMEVLCKNATSLTEIHELCKSYLQNEDGICDPEGTIAEIIEQIDEDSYDTSMLEDLLRIGHFNVILSTSISNKFRHVVEDYADDTNQTFIYDELGNELANIEEWKNIENQILFINLMGCNFAAQGNTLSQILTSEEDMIYFIHSWISANEHHPLFKSHLQNRFMLMLGCNVPSWAFRFIWYLIKNPSGKSSTDKDHIKYTVCTRSDTNADERAFAKKLYADIMDIRETANFLNDLKKQWKDSKHFKEKIINHRPGRKRDVFISYASEDREIVEQHIIPILKRLRTTERITYWYDKRQIKAAREWDREIEEGVRTARIFLTLQTGNSLKVANNPQRYLKQEWNIATNCQESINRELNDSETRFTYILPVIVGDENNYAEVFKSLNIQHISIEDQNELKQAIMNLIQKNRQFDIYRETIKG